MTAEASVTSATRPAFQRASRLVRSISQRNSSTATAMPRNRNAMTKPPCRFAQAIMISGSAYNPR